MNREQYRIQGFIPGGGGGGRGEEGHTLYVLVSNFEMQCSLSDTLAKISFHTGCSYL